MSDYLPDHLWVQILMLLPAKTLVRSSCVCKSWNTIVTSSQFIHSHLDRTRVSTVNDHTNRFLLLRYCVREPYHKELYSLRIDNPTFDLYKNLDFPFRTFCKGQNFRMLGSSNGLVCLADDLNCKTDCYILWNPSITKSVTLPVPQYASESHGPFDDAVGFGFDLRTNDYKVVRLVFFNRENVMSHKVELFKLSTWLWETISAAIRPGYWVEYDLGHVLLNGAAHWMASDQDSDSPRIILSFDMSEELFNEIMLPVSLANEYAEELYITLCGECLSLISYPSYEIDIWVMKEYGVVDSWIKLYTLDLRGVRRPINIKINCEMLLEMNDGNLFSYYVKIQQAIPLDICDSNESLLRFKSSFYVGTYEESLVLLGYGNRSRKDTHVNKEVKDGSGDHKEQD